MTLFDGKPLTPEEVNARVLCECGHYVSDHDDHGRCAICECFDFLEAEVDE